MHDSFGPDKSIVSTEKGFYISMLTLRYKLYKIHNNNKKEIVIIIMIIEERSNEYVIKLQ